jgi:hypothetical protein
MIPSAARGLLQRAAGFYENLTRSSYDEGMGVNALVCLLQGPEIAAQGGFTTDPDCNDDSVKPESEQAS